MFSSLRLFIVSLLLILLSIPAFGGQHHQPGRDLHGSHLKAYFDVNIGIAPKLETRLRLINTTYEQLLGQGVRPEFIVGFRGKASFFITNGDDYVGSEELVLKKKIHQWLKIFKDKGIRMEQCRIAAGLHGIEPNEFRPEVEVVDNGYVSMIVYQNQGFSQIPMD